jgi:hypothetical protein
MTQENFFKQNPQLVASNAQNNRLHPHDPRIKIKKAQAENLFANIEDLELKKTLTSIFIQMD